MMKKILMVFLFLFALVACVQAEDVPLFANITGYMRYSDSVDVTLNAGTKGGVAIGMEGALLDGDSEIGKVTVESVTDNSCKALITGLNKPQSFSSSFRVKFMVENAVKTEPQKETETFTPPPSVPSPEIKSLTDENQKLKLDMEGLKKTQEDMQKQMDEIKTVKAPAVSKGEKPVAGALEKTQEPVKISGEVISKVSYDPDAKTTEFYVNDYSHLTFSGNLPKKTGWLVEFRFNEDVSALVHQAYVAPVFRAENKDDYGMLKFGKFHVPFGLGERGTDDDMVRHGLFVDTGWDRLSFLSLDVHRTGIGLDSVEKDFSWNVSVTNPIIVNEDFEVSEAKISRNKDFTARIEFGNDKLRMGASYASYKPLMISSMNVTSPLTFSDAGVHFAVSGKNAGLKAEQVWMNIEEEDSSLKEKLTYLYVNGFLGFNPGTGMTATWRRVNFKDTGFHIDQFAIGFLFKITPLFHFDLEEKVYKEKDSDSKSFPVLTAFYHF